jgi:putative transposase
VHVSFTATAKAIVSPTDRDAVVGIDRGVVGALASSDGAMLRIPTTSKLEAKVIRLNQQLARQHKSSARRGTTRATRARTLAKITDYRRNWVEKTTTRLVREYDVTDLEDLAVKNMVRTPEPDPECPGAYLANGARSKAGLHRSIHRSCWCLFQARLQTKATQASVRVLPVDPAYTSQQCWRCGHTAPENRESQAEFRCITFGHTNHAGFNTAENSFVRGVGSFDLLAHAPGHGKGAGTTPVRRSPPLVAAGTSGKVAA